MIEKNMSYPSKLARSVVEEKQAGVRYYISMRIEAPSVIIYVISN
jgi:hypothetical protein